MRPFARMLIFFGLALVTVTSWTADTSASSLPRGAELVGVAQSGGEEHPLDQQMKEGLDSLLPRLRQLPADSPILIESHYPANNKGGKESRIKRAYALAEQVQQYFTSRHNLRFDYYISVWENGDGSDADLPKVRISAYPVDFF